MSEELCWSLRSGSPQGGDQKRRGARQSAVTLGGNTALQRRTNTVSSSPCGEARRSANTRCSSAWEVQGNAGVGRAAGALLPAQAESGVRVRGARMGSGACAGAWRGELSLGLDSTCDSAGTPGARTKKSISSWWLPDRDGSSERNCAPNQPSQQQQAQVRCSHAANVPARPHRASCYAVGRLAAMCAAQQACVAPAGQWAYMHKRPRAAAVAARKLG